MSAEFGPRLRRSPGWTAPKGVGGRGERKSAIKGRAALGGLRPRAGRSPARQALPAQAPPALLLHSCAVHRPASRGGELKFYPTSAAKIRAYYLLVLISAARYGYSFI